jgi:hypothetical protein
MVGVGHGGCRSAEVQLFSYSRFEGSEEEDVW